MVRTSVMENRLVLVLLFTLILKSPSLCQRKLLHI